MPWQDTHEAITRALFGQPYPEFHRERGKGGEYGPIHRFFPRHGPLFDVGEALRTGDPKMLLVGLAHDLADWSPLTIGDFLRGKYGRA